VLGQAQAARSARRWLLASIGVLVLELLAGAITARVNGNAPFAQWLGLACRAAGAMLTGSLLAFT
jgi:hypothetical protein